MNLENITLQSIQADWLTVKQVGLEVLRLDKIDAVISGNKWFKLKYYLEEAKALQKNTIATFGGAWSNHIIAVAYACSLKDLKSIGIIRGERPAELSYTLQKAIEYGMELKFVTRDQYRRKDEIKNSLTNTDWFWINEGGYGELGAKGAAEILSLADINKYTHVVAAVGTGTMLAGLLLASTQTQQIIGISSMKGNLRLESEIWQLTGQNKPGANFTIFHDYHFGGYGKHPPELLNFINEVYQQHNLPLDIVYTGKTFYGLKDLVEKEYFAFGSNVLMIHSGGLQGNNSLHR